MDSGKSGQSLLRFRAGSRDPGESGQVGRSTINAAMLAIAVGSARYPRSSSDGVSEFAGERILFGF